jgi:hypothetical protein
VKLLGLEQRVFVDVYPTAWLNIILIKEHRSLLMDYLAKLEEGEHDSVSFSHYILFLFYRMYNNKLYK